MNKDLAHVIRLREETNVSMMTCKELLENHSYDEAKQMIMDVVNEIKVGDPKNRDGKYLSSLPSWKSNIIKCRRGER